MKIKITRINIYNKDGKTIYKPNNNIIDMDDLDDFRESVKDYDDDTVLFCFEELGDNYEQ